MEIDATSFSTYELDLIGKELAEAAAEHPEGPGLSALRAAAVRRLGWDRGFRDCWLDPDFAAKYQWLRTYLVQSVSGELTCSTASAIVGEMLAIRSAAEEPF